MLIYADYNLVNAKHTQRAPDIRTCVRFLTISQVLGFSHRKERSAGPRTGRRRGISCNKSGARGSILDTCLQKCIMRHVRLATGRQCVSPVVHRYRAATEVSDLSSVSFCEHQREAYVFTSVQM